MSPDVTWQGITWLRVDQGETDHRVTKVTVSHGSDGPVQHSSYFLHASVCKFWCDEMHVGLSCVSRTCHKYMLASQAAQASTSHHLTTPALQMFLLPLQDSGFRNEMLIPEAKREEVEKERVNLLALAGF